MNFYFTAILALSIAIIHFHCKTLEPPGQNHSLEGNEMSAYGRHDITADGALELISSGSFTGYEFEGEELLLHITIGGEQHNYLQYELDGQYKGRVKLLPGHKQPVYIKAKGPGKHLLWVYKATEATTGPVMINDAMAKNIKSLQVPQQPLIEFIGNSITCGAASDASETPCGTGFYHDQHNAYQSYGPIVARELGTNYILSCVSGIGIYRNWNSDAPVMKDVYENLSLTETDKRSYSFRDHIPEIVSIALGTNDFSKGDGIKARLPFDSTRFINEYISFVKLVKSKYPQAKIALLTSPAVGNENAAKHFRYLLSVKAEIDSIYPESYPVSVFASTPVNAKGCTGHPGVEDHANMAGELVPFYRQLLDQN